MADHGPREVIEEAAGLLARLGKDAARYAWVNAEQMNEYGNETGAAYWAQVASAVVMLEKVNRTIH